MSPGTVKRLRPCSRCPPATSTPVPSRSTVDAEGLERALRMISRRDHFDDPRPSRRVKSREQHAALHLRARHLRFVCNRVQRAAVDGERRTAVRASMRAPIFVSGSMIRRIGRRWSECVAGQNGPKRMPGDDPRHQPHRRPGIQGVERAGRRVQTARRPRPKIVIDAGPVRRIVTPRRAQALERRRAIGARRETADGRIRRRPSPTAWRSDARWTCRRARGRARGADCRGNRDRISGRTEHTPHYSIRPLDGIRFSMLFTRVPRRDRCTHPFLLRAGPSSAGGCCPHAEARRHRPTPDPQQVRHGGLRAGRQRSDRTAGRTGRRHRALDWRRRPRIGDQRHQTRQSRGLRQDRHRRIRRHAGRRSAASSSSASSIRARDSNPTRSPIRWPLKTS